MGISVAVTGQSVDPSLLDQSLLRLMELLQQMVDSVAQDIPNVPVTERELRTTHLIQPDFEEDLDPLGILDATAASEADEYVQAIDQDNLQQPSTMIETRGSSTQMTDSLELFLSPQDSPVFSQPGTVPAVSDPPPEAESPDLIVLGSNDVLQYPQYEEEKEPSYFRSLLVLLECDWRGRVIKGFHRYMDMALSHFSKATQEALEKELLVLLNTPAPFAAVEDPMLFYKALSAFSKPKELFSYIASALVTCSCSESSCERLFSHVKWIIGDRRRRLHLRTLSLLLQIIMNKEYVDSLSSNTG